MAPGVGFGLAHALSKGGFLLWNVEYMRTGPACSMAAWRAKRTVEKDGKKNEATHIDTQICETNSICFPHRTLFRNKGRLRYNMGRRRNNKG